MDSIESSGLLNSSGASAGIHLFIYLFIHLFIYSFIHLFIYSFIHPLVYSYLSDTKLYSNLRDTKL